MGILDRILNALGNAVVNGRPVVRVSEGVPPVYRKQTAQKAVQIPAQEPVQDHPTEPEKPKIYGTHGRLEIPMLNISVPLYDTKGLSAQEIVDRADSAGYMRWTAQDAIADHVSQGNFRNLYNAVVGLTEAIVDTKEDRKTYSCVKKQVGHICVTPEGNKIFDANWVPVPSQNAGGLCIYTCRGWSADNVMDVCLTYWQPVRKEKEET